jgi:hypothetical protein
MNSQALIPTWFKAQDVVLRDLTPFTTPKQQKNSKPLIWKPFSNTDSLLLDDLFNDRFKSESKSVAVGEDALYEADILKYEISPSNY